jgi:hypothetical protein
MHIRIAGRVKNHLCFAIFIAQINKYNAAQIAPPIHPSAKYGFLSNITATQLAAVMCAFHFFIL